MEVFLSESVNIKNQSVSEGGCVMPREQANKEREEKLTVSVESPELSETPLTIGNLVKWISVTFTVVTVVVSCVWFIASVKTENMMLKQDMETIRARIVDVDRQDLVRHDQQEKEIGELTRRTDNTEKMVQEMARKLDVAVALLERIDSKVGKP